MKIREQSTDSSTKLGKQNTEPAEINSIQLDRNVKKQKKNWEQESRRTLWS